MDKRYAIIVNDIVSNIAVSESALSSNWIEILENQACSIGWRYEDGEFIYAEPEPVIEPIRITKLAFKQRLTQTERIAIRAAASSNPVVYDFLDILDSATFVDLQRQDTIDGINAMESAGLLAVGRATEILNAPVQDHERFNG